MSSTAPVKSQPLHNFSLPYLKWGKNQTSNQRCRKQQQQPTSVDHHLQQHRNKNSNHGGSGCCSASEAESDSGSSHHQDQPGGSASATNLVIRIPKVAKPEDGDDAVGKPWNLRPRRAILKNENGGGGGCEVEGDMNQNPHQHQHQQQYQQSQYQPKSLRLRGLVEGENVEKKEKHKFSIPLTKEEIEEDFFAWTGSKPSRRPKKRNKTVQKHVDNAFPGLWLAGITADTYEVAELPAKKKKK